MITSVPDSVLGQHIGILGKTGSGKSYAAKGVAERLLAAKKRVCVIDPTDGWWGLRSGADGKSAGFPVVVFGGPHGDVPIGRDYDMIRARFHGRPYLTLIVRAVDSEDAMAVLCTDEEDVGKALAGAAALKRKVEGA